MEEQKGKVVEMIPQTKETEQTQKMSYEQLEQVAHQLSEQTRHLYKKLQESNMNNMFKRLDYLFKVVKLGDTNWFSSEFVTKCAEEIEEIMTVPDNTDTEPDNKD